MLIGALQRFSLLDYPGKISCIVFTQGCNFRCPYCHNPELVEPHFFMLKILPPVVFSFLAKRIKKIDAVVITGGEPTIQSDLVNFVQKIKDMGFLVKLDTNGSNPEVLARLLENKLLDYIAMDIKAPLPLYQKVTRTFGNGSLSERIKKSIQLILASGINYEFRTTVVKEMLTTEDILEIAGMIEGANQYVLQRFVPSKTLDHTFLSHTSFSQKDFDLLLNRFVGLNISCSVR
jgi:pyruvate formate lyase activating enzyme